MQRPAKPFTPVRFRIQPPKFMKVAIIGYGFVGKALRNGLRDNVDCIEIDPKLNTNISDLADHKPEIVFICLPTPMSNDGSQNIDVIKKTISQINSIDQKLLIVIKSTILPKYVKEICEDVKNIIINPEFLRERFAEEDFINSDIIIFGGDNKDCEIISNFYINHTKCLSSDHTFTDHMSASLIKYTINSFLALKVIFFNQINSVFNHISSQNDWKSFTNAVSKDKRMGDSHMDVPGPDGRFGYGGPCFPKDVSALIEYSKELGLELSLLKKANNINNNLRAEYNDVFKREEEQNIKFNANKEE